MKREVPKGHSIGSGKTYRKITAKRTVVANQEKVRVVDESRGWLSGGKDRVRNKQKQTGSSVRSVAAVGLTSWFVTKWNLSDPNTFTWLVQSQSLETASTSQLFSIVHSPDSRLWVHQGRTTSGQLWWKSDTVSNDRKQTVITNRVRLPS